jgi:hypothetical protein
MKALSLWQPWATVMALGHKKIETRGKSTVYRGRLAIQAAITIMVPGDPAFKKALNELGIDPFRIPTGAIVGICNLVDVVLIGSDFQVDDQERLFGNYAIGRYAWITEEMQPVDPPIPCRGHQWLFDWEDPTEKAEMEKSR